MMAPKADKVVPMFSPQLLGEPVPETGASSCRRWTSPASGWS
jgi:L-rhamnonate dehydratase